MIRSRWEHVRIVSAGIPLRWLAGLGGLGAVDSWYLGQWTAGAALFSAAIVVYAVARLVDTVEEMMDVVDGDEQ